VLYFIEDVDGVLGHPTRKADMIRRWLKSGRATVKDRSADWMLIKINKKIDSSKTIPCQFRLGVDPGYENIGFVVYKITEPKVEKILIGEAKLRTKDVTLNMIERKMHRRSRRYYRRKNVKRKYGSCKFRKPIWKNRRKHEFQPTHNHLIQAHLNVLNKIFRLVPLEESHIVVEYVKFDTQKLVNPSITHFERGKGPQYGFENVKAYVRFRDSYTCQVCKSKDMLIIEAHHIIPRSQNGPDTPENMICLCTPCHDKVQNGRIKCPKQNPNTYSVSGVLNSVMKEIYSIITNTISSNKTYGYVTDAYRKNLHLEKTHAGDASIIAFCDEESMCEIEGVTIIDNPSHMYLKQYRRHVRNWVQRYEDRKYYYGKSCVAWNRRTRDGQDKKKPSLEEFRQEYGDTKVISKPGATRYRRSNINVLFRPGDLLEIKPPKKELGLFPRYFDTCQGWASTRNTILSINSSKEIPKRYVTKNYNNCGLVNLNTIQ
jgi:hypothetical protein